MPNPACEIATLNTHLYLMEKGEHLKYPSDVAVRRINRAYKLLMDIEKGRIPAPNKERLTPATVFGYAPRDPAITPLPQPETTISLIGNEAEVFAPLDSAPILPKHDLLREQLLRKRIQLQEQLAAVELVLETLGGTDAE